VRTWRPGPGYAPGLRARLRAGNEQHEAALAWLVAGAVDWYRRGRVLPDPPATVVAATQEWRHSADQLLRYRDERLIFDPHSCVMSTDLYDDFSSWLSAHGHHGWTDQSFTARFGQHSGITAHGVERKRIRSATSRLTLSRPQVTPFGKLPQRIPAQYYAWLGVRFRTDVDTVEETL
jgi:phage/plasmid-associated DNA primase